MRGIKRGSFIAGVVAGLVAGLVAGAVGLLFAQTGTPEKSTQQPAEKVYASLTDIPMDGKTYSLAPIAALQTAVRVRGMSYRAAVPDGDLKGETFLGLAASSIRTKSRDVKTLFRLDLMLLPSEAPKQYYRLYFDQSDARKAYAKMDDARRIGRNWRTDGLTNEKKTLTVDLTSRLKLTLTRIALDERITPTLTYSAGAGKEVSHSFVNFAEFSAFLDWFDTFLKWADEQRAKG